MCWEGGELGWGDDWCALLPFYPINTIIFYPSMPLTPLTRFYPLLPSSISFQPLLTPFFPPSPPLAHYFIFSPPFYPSLARIFTRSRILLSPIFSKTKKPKNTKTTSPSIFKATNTPTPALSTPWRIWQRSRNNSVIGATALPGCGRRRSWRGKDLLGVGVGARRRRILVGKGHSLGGWKWCTWLINCAGHCGSMGGKAMRGRRRGSMPALSPRGWKV